MHIHVYLWLCACDQETDILWKITRLHYITWHPPSRFNPISGNIGTGEYGYVRGEYRDRGTYVSGNRGSRNIDTGEHRADPYQNMAVHIRSYRHPVKQETSFCFAISQSFQVWTCIQDDFSSPSCPNTPSRRVKFAEFSLHLSCTMLSNYSPFPLDKHLFDH